MTDGTWIAFFVECTSVWLVSSACATPFSISTSARRTAVTLMGSKVAFSTSTGACITEGRLAAGLTGATVSGATPPSPIAGRGRKPCLSRISICAAFASLDEFPLASRDARRTLLVSPAWFCILLQLLLGTRGRPAWHDSRHRQSQHRRRARLL